jgi:GTP-binding protein
MTKGEAIITSKLKGYEEFKGPIKRVTKGAIVSMTKGKCTQYALKDAENHGELFVFPGYEVYEGMVIGELNKDGGEIELSPIREKAVTNVRTVLKEENIKLQPHRSFTIEDAMVMLRGDELLEVTPKYLRIRKTVLDNALRRKMKREKRIDENL